MAVLLILATVVMAVIHFGGFFALPLWLVFGPLALVVVATIVQLVLVAVAARKLAEDPFARLRGKL